MDSTLMLDPETISKRFTQEIEIDGRRERLFYRDPRIQEADEELARKLNQELNPDYNFEESLKEQRRNRKKKTPKAPRGRGRGRGRGRTQSVPARPIEKGIMIREPAEQSRSSLSSQPTESTDRKGKGILIEEPKKKSKKSYSSVPESVQSTPAVEEEKKSEEVVESILNANPESSTLQSTANPEASNPDNVQNSANPDGNATTNPDEANPDGNATANPDGTNPDEDSTANPDGHEDANPDPINPDDQGITDTHDSEGDEVQNQQNNSAAEGEGSEEINPDQEDGGEKASWLKVKLYVYKNKVINRERARTAVTEAFKRYIYNIKKFKEKWRKPLAAVKHADRRRHSPSRPRRRSKFDADYTKRVNFIPESGQVQILQEPRQYKYSWAEMADKVLAIQDDYETFGLGHPKFQRNAHLTQLGDSAPLLRRIDETLSQEHLDRLISVSLIMDQVDGRTDKEKIIYFLEDGQNYKINEVELMQKSWKELEHVMFMLNEKNSVCKRWRRRIEATAAFQKKCIQVNKEFKPKYLNADGVEIEMKKGDAKLESFLGKTMLTFNPESIKGYAIDIGSGMHRSKIKDLRAAIYQLEANTDELRRIKAEMEKHLEAAEEKLVDEFLNMNPMFRRIEEADNL